MSIGKRYTDDEVHAIFERAALRQEEAKEAEDASRSGLSLEELQDIGADAGIDPAHIALAATELATVGKPSSSSVDAAFLGIPTRIGTSRVIRGHVGDERWEQIVPQLREIFGRDGIAGELGNVREWTVASSFGRSDRPTKVTLKPEGDDTLVTINQEMKGQAMGFSIATGIYVAMALVMMLINVFTRGDGPPTGVSLMFLGMAVLFFGGAQIGTRLHAKRQYGRFERVLDRVELIANQASDSDDRQAAPRPQVDLNELPDAPSDLAGEALLRRRERE